MLSLDFVQQCIIYHPVKFLLMSNMKINYIDKIPRLVIHHLIVMVNLFYSICHVIDLVDSQPQLNIFKLQTRTLVVSSLIFS